MEQLDLFQRHLLHSYFRRSNSYCAKLYEFKHGRKVVEEFLDAVLSIEEHIDPNFFIRKSYEYPDSEADKQEAAARAATKTSSREKTLKSKARVCRRRMKNESTNRVSRPRKRTWAIFIMKNSPTLEPWQRDVMAMLDEEREYLIPQLKTKIMNEGWASIWHSRIMREMDLPTNEHLEFAELHAGVVSPHKGQLNPYHLGYKILSQTSSSTFSSPSIECRSFTRLRGQLGGMPTTETRIRRSLSPNDSRRLHRCWRIFGIRPGLVLRAKNLMVNDVKLIITGIIQCAALNHRSEGRSAADLLALSL